MTLNIFQNYEHANFSKMAAKLYILPKASFATSDFLLKVFKCLTKKNHVTLPFPTNVWYKSNNSVEQFTRTRCEICSKLAIKIPERRHWFSYDKVVILIICVFMSRKKQHLVKIVEIYKLSGPITSNYVYKRLKLPQRRI